MAGRSGKLNPGTFVCDYLSEVNGGSRSREQAKKFQFLVAKTRFSHPLQSPLLCLKCEVPLGKHAFSNGFAGVAQW